MERLSPHPAAHFIRVDPPPPGEDQDAANSLTPFPIRFSNSHSFAISRREPEFLPGTFRLLKIRGRREFRAPDAPDSRVCGGVESTKAHALVRSHRNHPAFPTQWFYGLLRALPGDRLVDTVTGEATSANLTPAPRRQDHTTSPSASAPFVKGAAHVHRIPPHVRDDRETPLCWGGTGRICRDDLPDGKSGEFFARGLDRWNRVEPLREIRFYAHAPTYPRKPDPVRPDLSTQPLTPLGYRITRFRG